MILLFRLFLYNISVCTCLEFVRLSGNKENRSVGQYSDHQMNKNLVCVEHKCYSLFSWVVFTSPQNRVRSCCLVVILIVLRTANQTTFLNHLVALINMHVKTKRRIGFSFLLAAISPVFFCLFPLAVEQENKRTTVQHKTNCGVFVA